MLIKILKTGGSIDKYYSTRESAFVVGEPQIAGILRDANAGLEFEVESILKKDSLEMTDADRQLIYERVDSEPNRRVIVTHGTDTMVETARALAGIKNQVIVLTGAMQPAAFKQSDAALNVGGAVVAVQILPDGIYIIMSGRVFDPQGTRKNLESDRFEAVS